VVNNRLRHRILRRDGWKCVYCGKGPPEVVLEIDHVTPVASGGSDDQSNLVTACRGCNQGKSDQPAVEPMPPPVLRVSDMSAAHIRAALLASMGGGGKLVYCPTCQAFLVIGPACEPPCCWHHHPATEVVP